MPTAVAYGSAYDLTVQTQPVGETCTVSNGSGTMPASAIADAAVNCSVNTYTIGGSISGLAASDLVLLDNGADATSIAANATQFTMNTGVAYGGGYAITVATQPAGETCQLGDGSGSVGANVTTVTLSCAPWSSFTESVLYSFAGGRSGNGKFPGAGLIQGSSDGNFYGTTFAEGASNLGTVFSITPAGVETLLYSFGGAPNDGSFPFAALIHGGDGNFYGTTSNGGANNDGTVFKITPAGVETVLYSFSGAPGDGAIPRAGLILGSDGNFYGTTQVGGTNSYGTVFKITPAGVETVLYSFGGVPDAANPFAALVQSSDGNFYGTTLGGGANSYGTVFKITPAGVETVLYSFGGAPDGFSPFAALVQGSDGNFWGTTINGGANDDGTVFSVTPAGVETVLNSFGASPSDGTRPQATLIQGSDGNFWGTTINAGANGDGTVFRITPAGVETVVYSFAGGPSDGANPQAALIQGSDANFYGIAFSGGANGDGMVFKIVPQ
jgi:uncharacterized repeat protein (TIGR03803 family)